MSLDWRVSRVMMVFLREGFLLLIFGILVRYFGVLRFGLVMLGYELDRFIGLCFWLWFR